MVWQLVSNPVLVAVAVLLALSALRMNVVFALVVASVAGGMMGSVDGGAAWGMIGNGEFHLLWTYCVSGFGSTMKSFLSNLDNGAVLAINYVMLGTFSIAISRSGVTELIARKLFQWIGCGLSARRLMYFKYMLLGILTLIAISSQNLIPMHIAFIPVLIPPLLPVFEKLRLDRRAVACVLTFGLITPYMLLPVGFGKIYLNNILLDNISRNGMAVQASQASPAMLIPALGMVAGLLIAVFFSYRKPRVYNPVETEIMVDATEPVEIRPFNVAVGVTAILMALFVQIFLDSLIIGALLAVMVFVIARVIRLRDTQDVFVQGVHLMGGIGIVMIAAAGFANVMKDSGGVLALVELVRGAALDYKGVTVFAMLLIGLVITMGIGSSFSTVPLIAAIYVPLCIAMGISPLATIAIVGSAGALGDAGSPVSESVLGPTAGLNADGQHDHIYDSTIPTFLHYNLPLLAAGWIAGMIL
ncbi:MAG: sodium:proton antiporter [Lentisphaeria bacterium]|nr:sodium:proton antiporter [Lentisphaeria bacterium]